MKELSMWEVGKIFSQPIPALRRRSHCPFRKHKRQDKSFKVFAIGSGEVLYKCFSCDPPGNVGDAVALYAALSGVDRKTAWRELRERGYAVPGLDRNRERDDQPSVASGRARVPIRGADQRDVLPLDLGAWRKWSQARTGAVERFAEMRGLDAEFLHRNDVVDVGPDVVGFGYRDPYSSLPCRVKCRPLDRKTFWIEPRPTDDDVTAKALGPLYLAHDLDVPMTRGSRGTHAVITEGEVDALTLRGLGFKNVVSLPDGCGSATKVDLEPISMSFVLWLVSTDADEDGDLAYRQLRRRGWDMNLTIARVIWRLGDEQFKDANDALAGGMVREHFESCLHQAAENALGFRLAV